MPWRSSHATPHRKMLGYEVCIHTCGCKKGRMQTLWPREGGACSRHSTMVQLHPNCSEDCPGNHAFQPGAQRSNKTRTPTREEILLYLPSSEATSELHRLGLHTAQDPPTEQSMIMCVSYAVCVLKNVKADHATDQPQMTNQWRSMRDMRDIAILKTTWR